MTYARCERYEAYLSIPSRPPSNPNARVKRDIKVMRQRDAGLGALT